MGGAAGTAALRQSPRSGRKYCSITTRAGEDANVQIRYTHWRSIGSCHPLTAFGVLVKFFSEQGFRRVAAPPLSTGCRPLCGLKIPRTSVFAKATPRQRRISCGLAAIHTAGTAVFLTRVSVYFIEGANATDCRHGALINIQG